MDVSAIKHQIQSKELQHLYIFSGVEWRVQRIYIEKIAEVSHKELYYADAISDIFSKVSNRSFIKKSYVYVVRDDKDFMTDEKLQTRLKAKTDNIIILLYTTLDKRTKFYKTYKDAIVDFEPLKPQILKKYIQREIALSDANCEKLMEVCENDYGRCLLEIDKIKRYTNYLGPAKMEDGVLEKLLQDGTIYTPPKDAIFELVDAILDRKTSCFTLFEQCKQVGEASMVLISVLYNNAKAVLQVQTCESSDVGKSTGLSGWEIMNAKKHVNKLKNSELLGIMDVCQYVQQAIVTGMLDEEFAMDYVFVNCL